MDLGYPLRKSRRLEEETVQTYVFDAISQPFRAAILLEKTDAFLESSAGGTQSRRLQDPVRELEVRVSLEGRVRAVLLQITGQRGEAEVGTLGKDVGWKKQQDVHGRPRNAPQRCKLS
jgi:hypothetical protein